MHEAWRQVHVRSSLALANHCVIPEVLRLEVASRLAVVPGRGAISLINLHGVLLGGSCCCRWPRLRAGSAPAMACPDWPLALNTCLLTMLVFPGQVGLHESPDAALEVWAL